MNQEKLRWQLLLIHRNIGKEASLSTPEKKLRNNMKQTHKPQTRPASPAPMAAEQRPESMWPLPWTYLGDGYVRTGVFRKSIVDFRGPELFTVYFFGCWGPNAVGITQHAALGMRTGAFHSHCSCSFCAPFQSRFS